MFCFAKSDKQNLNKNEVAQYKIATGIYLGFSEIELTAALKKRVLEEITYHDEEI